MKAAVELKNVVKSFGFITVLDGIDLSVPEGSFTSLLGPSGCGKTTLLNIIGGLDKPTEGEIRFGDELIYSAPNAVNVPTEHRNVGYVFQSYALWPHMTVLQNVGFPLRIRGLAATERNRRSQEMLERLELGHLADRYPFQLSGGQQQRVAIARSLVYQPRLLLLDEPLSNLDAQLRERARAWLKNVHETFKLTVILVTHDQAEALSLSDHIVLLNKGRIEQQGPARKIYEEPRTAYAADFVGGANVIAGRLDDTGTVLVTDNGNRIVSAGREPGQPGAPACVSVRPQKMRLLDRPGTDGAGTTLPFAPSTVLYLGGAFEIVGKSPVGELRILSQSPPEGTDLHVFLPADECLRVLP